MTNKESKWDKPSGMNNFVVMLIFVGGTLSGIIIGFYLGAWLR